MKPFEHIDFEDLKELLDFLSVYPESSKLIAGGTDLLGLLKDNLIVPYPKYVLNLKKIKELWKIVRSNGELLLGALVTLNDIIKSPELKGYELLKQAAHAVASPQIRNMGTLGGNLLQETRCWYFRYPHKIGGRFECLRRGGEKCYAASGDHRFHSIMNAKGCIAVCPSDMAVALTAFDAQLKFVSKKGQRILSVPELYTSMGNTIAPDEVLAEIAISSPPANSEQIYLKFAFRYPIEFATVSVAVLVSEEDGVCKDVRIVLGAVAPAPVRAKEAEEFLKGKPITERNATEAAEVALKGAKPLRMNAYKVRIAKTLVKRALLRKEI